MVEGGGKLGESTIEGVRGQKKTIEEENSSHGLSGYRSFPRIPGVVFRTSQYISNDMRIWMAMSLFFHFFATSTNEKNRKIFGT